MYPKPCQSSNEAGKLEIQLLQFLAGKMRKQGIDRDARKRVGLRWPQQNAVGVQPTLEYEVHYTSEGQRYS